MLKVVRHHHNNIEEVYPINGIYKVYELDTYELEYSSDSPIVEQNVFLEDILLDYSLFNISQSRIETIKPEYLFIDYFGFASLRINNEIFNFNILIEKLKKNDAEDMLMYLWEKDKYLYNIFLSKSSVTASNVQETDINLTSKFINHMNYFHDKMLEYSVYFKSLPYYVLRPKSELSKYSVNLVDADSIPWILENLNVVSFSPELRYDPDAINFNGAYGIINQLLINKPDHCYSTYENNIILGSFLRLINKLSSLKKEICNNIDVTERYSDEHYLDFRDLKKVPYVRLLKDAIEIKRKLENLYLRYKNIFIDATPKIERPILTPVFIGRRHYANAFRLIQKTWNAKFDFQGDILLFNIQKMSHPLACALEILERTLTERVRLVEGMCTNRESGLHSSPKGAGRVPNNPRRGGPPASGHEAIPAAAWRHRGREAHTLPRRGLRLGIECRRHRRMLAHSRRAVRARNASRAP